MIAVFVIGLTGLLLIGLVLSVGACVAYGKKLQTVAIAAPQIALTEARFTATVSVIVPAYNEAVNIADCLRSVLASSDWGAEQLDVWVVDDQSTDETLAIAQNLQATLADPRLHVLAGQPRPHHQTWMGKNWACYQAVQQAKGELLLFLDADVRLQPGAIASAIATLQTNSIDLLTFWPTIVCGCWAEWLAQPLIVGLLAAGLPFTDVNNPKSDAVFAVGPFMLFRRTAYAQIGGHEGVANQVVEDVELARRIKQAGLKLHYALGHSLASVRMYRSGQALWEGWTKNWYLGGQRDLSLALYTIAMVFLVCGLPLVGLLLTLAKGTWLGWSWVDGWAIALSLTAILLHRSLRHAIAQLSAIPPRYWWLTSVGGLFLIAIIIASIIKTETGWGWTWRGRPLQRPEALGSEPTP